MVIKVLLVYADTTSNTLCKELLICRIWFNKWELSSYYFPDVSHVTLCKWLHKALMHALTHTCLWLSHRSSLDVFLSNFPLWLFQFLSFYQELTNLHRLDSQPVLLSAFLWPWDCKHLQPYLGSHVSSRNQTQVFMVIWQELYLLSYLSSLKCFFFTGTSVYWIQDGLLQVLIFFHVSVSALKMLC